MHKTIETFYIIIILLFSSTLQYSQEYKLLWSDEFIGRQLDENIWTRETGASGWGNEELQYYTDRDTNAYVKDGVLTIRALNEKYGGSNYTSARLITKDTKYFNYGKIEARIKLPYGQGIWPAFWLLGQNINTVSWPACGEIDILELVGGGSGKDNRVHGTAHWEQNGHASYGGYYTLSSGIFADDFHLFSVEWTPQFIKWSVDGIQYHVIDITPSQLSEFQKDFFIILNIAIGGIWPGYPDDTTVFPQTMEVDFIRVYQDISKFPEIQLTQPSITNFPEYSNIQITADANYNGNIEKVEFYQDRTQIGESYIEPFEMIWRDVYPGEYKIKAKVITEDGYNNESYFVNINVGDGSTPSPYTGTSIPIPGEFEAEDFNIGGMNVGYYDNSLQNIGFTYRTMESVDIETCNDIGGGFNIGWTETGEWIAYLIDVSEEGNYNLTARVASIEDGCSFKVFIDDQVLSESVAVPNTGGLQFWTSVTSNISLSSGEHSLKIQIENGDFNLNRFEIYLPESLPNIELLSPLGGEVFEAGTVQEIRWNKIKVDRVSIGFSSDGGNSWSFIAKDVNGKFGFYNWLVPEANSDECLIMIIDAENSSINDLNITPFSITNITSAEHNELIPGKYRLKQNYPNPFNPETKIEYTIPIGGRVKLKIYDQLGHKVKTLIDKHQSIGNYKVSLNASDLASGVYIYQLSTNNIILSKKLILLK